MINRCRALTEEADTGLSIGVAHFEWLRQMADVHNFGNVRKTLADVINSYLKALNVDRDLRVCLKSMRRDVSGECAHPLRKGCICTEQRLCLMQWASCMRIDACELLDAIVRHAIIEGDEEELFENVRVHENTMALYMDLQMGKKITVDTIH
mmetsp:Transcript_17173/g.69555  ORF Transcript_17173/g.69555 Transcript_17173/m.69555 type:complete len:152 (-) Transcript_17173:44-499(-)|eukprot:CAMPEP_0113959792 /NCGR_PEP_ID=MMETSP0011_2-20120614/4347_1 /TAXON_ID=101924 /ORGANISM="Rhodosorus marinus" /LENGTH=151 /DNA_ID=CAMNT_0000971155 /DNA_START=491 /DNA_END=946 /DNA_ORIENTATION=- /assembly_acc=CAM_ASM_000156